MPNSRLSDLDVVILAGGQGTRIRHLLPGGMPKYMADVNGTPFISILLQHLSPGSFRRFILSMGHAEVFNKRFSLHDLVNDLPVRHSVEMFCEETPLGTAGAVRYIAGRCEVFAGFLSPRLSDPFFIFNGDTFCDVDYAAMLDYHLRSKSVVIVAHDDWMRHVGTFVASRRLIDLIPETGDKYDMEDLFTLLGKSHEPVGWFYAEARYWDIGSPEGLETFRREEPWKK